MLVERLSSGDRLSRWTNLAERRIQSTDVGANETFELAEDGKAALFTWSNGWNDGERDAAIGGELVDVIFGSAGVGHAFFRRASDSVTLCAHLNELDGLIDTLLQAECSSRLSADKIVIAVSI